ncbi:hypothetical protein ACHAXA_011033 [Cyclostephanos tholiformis]|uniref:Uncharacterized protein n=1 Tax=Cyclostephanos tholiformis TaxID=382380 RepID=A0ABD3RYT7_9STRA
MKAHARPIFTPTNLNHNLLNRLRENDNALVRIIFSSRDLGCRGVPMLAEVLRSNNKLEALDLSSNSIGPSGAYFVGLLLQRQSMIPRGMTHSVGGVKTLILSDNNLRDAGVRLMAQALEGSIVECLWIDGNCITAKGLAALAESLQRNSNLRRLHIHHNWFQSLSPLITCMFNKQNLGSVADSNHTLKHVFLNCGYSYEWKELETLLTINRKGRLEARRQKLALYLGANPVLLLQLGLDPKLLPLLLAVLTLTDSISSVFRVVRDLPSEILFLTGIHTKSHAANEFMDAFLYSSS